MSKETSKHEAFVAEAYIQIDYPSIQLASLIAGSIAPDNKPLPKGVTVSSRAEENSLRVFVSSTRPLLSLLTTVDDFLSMITLAEKTIKESNKAITKKQP